MRSALCALRSALCAILFSCSLVLLFLVYPEGTRFRSSAVPQFRGSAVLAIEIILRRAGDSPRLFPFGAIWVE